MWDVSRQWANQDRINQGTKAHKTSNEYSVLLVYLHNNTVLKEENQIFNTVWFWFILIYVDKCLIQDVFCLAHFSLLMFRLI